jgi:hypothetical protein
VDCAWNDAIRDGIALTFAIAVERFARADDPLRFSWLDYLPTELKQDHWKTLYPAIQAQLRQRPILQTWETGEFRLPGELRQLSHHMLHDGEPILGDLEDEEYLAPDYAYRHHSALAALGSLRADMSHMVKRLEADLCHRHSSRVKTTQPSDPWHEAFAELFLTPFTKTAKDVVTMTARMRLRTLPFIPLKGRKQWTGAPGVSPGGLANLYFSNSNDVPIPDSLGFKLLDEVASSNTKRKAFYKALGVEECPQALVLASIQKKHGYAYETPDVISHFQYLFRIGEEPSSIQEWIRVPTDDGDWLKPNPTRLYFPSEGKHDLYRLFKQTKAKLEDFADFMDISLFELGADETNRNGLTWQAWLQKATGARYYPPLLEEENVDDTPCLSPALKAVCKHKPKMFMSTLKAHWEDYKDEAAMVEHDLGECRVRCVSTDREPLKMCYLPTKNVIDRVQELNLSPVNFPILSLRHLNNETDRLDKAGDRQWRFLEEFGARFQPDLDFYKRALRTIQQSGRDPSLDVLKVVYRYMAEIATARDQPDLRYVATVSSKLLQYFKHLHQ